MFSWAVSPLLEKIHRVLEEQRQFIDEARRCLEDRLLPFQKYLADQKLSVEQSLRQLEARMKPLRLYVQGQEQTLDRISLHLNENLRGQFDVFARYLEDQRRIFTDAMRYLDGQPRPYHDYLNAQQRLVELVYRDLEEKFTSFIEHLERQQRVLNSINHPDVLEEFKLMVEYAMERQRALERFSGGAAFHPAQLFAELTEIYSKFKSLAGNRHDLMGKFLEESRIADQYFHEQLEPPLGEPIMPTAIEIAPAEAGPGEPNAP